MRAVTTRNLKILLLLALTWTASAAQAVTLSGVVFGGGSPMAGAEVSLYQVTQEQTESDPAVADDGSLGTATTDTNGSYSFEVAEIGLYDLVVAPPVESGFGNTVVPNIDVRSNDVSQNIVLVENAAILSGTVHDGSGNPISGIHLTVSEQASGTEVGQLVSDASGAYAIAVASGTYEIDARYDYRSVTSQPSPERFNVQPLVTDVIVAADTTQDLALPFVTISGRTTDQNGVAISGVEVKADSYWSDYTAIGQYQFRSVLNSTFSDVDGNYSLVVVSGLDSLTFTPPADSGLATTVSTGLALIEDTQRDFALEPERILSGTVLDGSGNPISGIHLTVSEQASGTEVGQLVSDASGAYAIAVASGTYEIDARYDYRSVTSQPSPERFNVQPLVTDVIVAADTTQDLALPFVTISGRTTDQNGVAISGVEVKADSYWSDYTAIGQYQFRSVLNSTVSDVDGNYSLVVVSGLDSETILPPLGSGFAQTVLSGLNLQADLKQNIILPFNDETAPVITSAPRATDITDTSAAIQWQTDEAASSMVTVNGVTYTVPGYRTLHSVAVSALTASQSYLATVSSTDEDGNGPVSSSASFDTLASPDSNAPVILEGPVITSVSNDRATVEWRTNEPATTQLNYGIGGLLDQSETITGLRSSHSVAITGLSANSTYTIQVSGTDAAGNGPVESPGKTFQTLPQPDTEAPVFVSAPVITDLSSDSVTVQWETDEPAVSAISLNDGTAYKVVRDENLKTSHSVTVTGLTSSTDYTYTVSATDALGNGPELSAPDAFRTLALEDTLAPVITGSLKIVGITHQSAVVHWRTDELSDSTIEFGTVSGELVESLSSAKRSRKHVLQLTNLEKDTAYYLRALSKDRNGNAVVTEEDSFRTRSLPDTAKPHFKQPPTVIGSSDDTVTLAWETDEPSDSVVEYDSSTGEKRSKGKGEKTNKHTVTLTGLKAGGKYSYTIDARDSSGNKAQVQSLNTEIVGTSWLKRTKTLATSVLGIGSAHAVGKTDGFNTNAEPDTTAPLFSLEPETVWSGSNRIIMEWVNNEPATAELRYGQSGAYSHVASNADSTLDHQLVLTQLQPGISYDYKLTVTDIAGNKTVRQGTFSSAAANDTVAPSISSLSASVLGDTVVDFGLRTDEHASVGVRYGVSESELSSSAASIGIDRLHSLRLSGLAAGTTYHYQFQVQDPAGNSTLSPIQAVATSGTAVDSDGDGVPDSEDIFPQNSGEWLDTDGNGIGNNTDTDDDGDGVEDASDAFPLDASESLDTDGNGIGNNADTDDDGDGLPDAFENENGFDSLDSSDASQDADNDGLSNLEEYEQGSDLFNPPADETAPVVIAPVDIRISASGDFTEVELGEASATDNVDGALAPLSDKSGPFEPGRHTITWSVSDAAGNTGTDAQIVDVLPIAGFEVDQFADEGSNVSVKVVLNGQPPEYPVTIPFELAGTADHGEDFTLSAQEISISEGREGSVVVDITSDDLEEMEEKIIIKMATPQNAVAGGKATHTIVITVSNQAPVASLNLFQNGIGASAATIDGGFVLVTSSIRDPNSNDTHTFDWNASDNAMVPSSSANPEEFRFDPAGLQQGVYIIRLTVTDNGTPPKSSSFEFPVTVISGAPLDPDENGNGLPDSLDINPDPSVMQATENGKLVTEAGLRLRIGSVASAGMNLSPMIDESLLAEHGSVTGGPGLNTEDSYTIIGGLFDFEIHDLRAAGQSVLLILPLSEAIPANGVYRKYVPDVGWQMFVEDVNNRLYSASSNGSECPAVGSNSYDAGIIEGNDCLQLRIQDGGPNDADAEKNGVIKDPSGVAVVSSSENPDGLDDVPDRDDKGDADGPESSSGGGGCTINKGAQPDPTLPLMVLISLIYLITKRRWSCKVR